MASKPKNNAENSEDKKTKTVKGAALEAKNETVKTSKSVKDKAAEIKPAPKTDKQASAKKPEKEVAKVEAKPIAKKITMKEEPKKEVVVVKKAVPAKKESSKEKELPKVEVVASPKEEAVKVEPKPVKKASKKEAPAKVEEPLKAEVPTLEPKEMPTVRYSDAELAMFEHVITDAKREAIEELTMLKERLDDLNSYDFAEESMIYSMHMAEQGSEAQEKEKTYAQIQRMTDHLRKLDEALQRIENKTYGICRVCNCLIAKERLLAVPITTLSAAYKIHKRCPEDGIDRIEPVGGFGK